MLIFNEKWCGIREKVGENTINHRKSLFIYNYLLYLCNPKNETYETTDYIPLFSDSYFDIICSEILILF